MMTLLTNSNSLTLAISKQEKLKEPILAFLKEKGFEIQKDGKTWVMRDSRGSIPNIRVEFVRSADALSLMQEKVVDFAMIGSDVADENTCGDEPAFEKPDRRFDLEIAKCSFNLAVPNEELEKFETPTSVNGLRIATSYPNLTKEWLKKSNIKPANIFVRQGDVESSIGMGLADVVTDLVDTGKTLRDFELTSAFQIATTSAVCYVRKDAGVLVNLMVDEVIRELKKKDQPFFKPAVNDIQYAVA
jgi:ATP phosphoribosyltransferase